MSRKLLNSQDYRLVGSMSNTTLENPCATCGLLKICII